MNFDFSEELQQLRNEARKFLDPSATRGLTRAVLEGTADAGGLWRDLAGLGWAGAALVAERVAMQVTAGRISGRKQPVTDGLAADFVIVMPRPRARPTRPGCIWSIAASPA